MRDGRIVENNAYADGMTIARQLGLMPPRGLEARAAHEGRLQRARRRPRKRLGGKLETVADGVWLLRGGFPIKTMNVYFVRDGDGVLIFDAGIKAMTNAVALAGAELGGITRVVLGHGHADHRGVAPGLGVPVFCHAADKADAEGDGGSHYVALPNASTRSASCCCPLLLGLGRRSGADRRHASPRATTSPASRSSTCPATRRA